MKEEKTVRESDRKITTTYTLENGYRVRISSYHYATGKAIRTTISECIARESGIFTMETHRVFSDYNAIVLSESVARYSFKLLEDQHARAVSIAAATVRELLSAGENNARECQKEVA